MKDKKLYELWVKSKISMFNIECVLNYFQDGDEKIIKDNIEDIQKLLEYLNKKNKEKSKGKK